MAISTIKRGSLGDTTQPNQYQQQSQANQTPGIVPGRTANGNAAKLDKGDMSLQMGTSAFTLRQGANKKTAFGVTLPYTLANYKLIEYQTGTVPPTVADNFPNDGDYGFYRDTSSSKTYWVISEGGVLLTPNIETLAGQLLAAQHGDLSAATALIMHSFPQINGVLSSSQHGDLSAATSLMHSFTSINGVLSSSQHGVFPTNSTNELLHGLATAARNGFMSAAGFAALDGATNAGTPSRIVMRSSGNAFDVLNIRLRDSSGASGSLLLGTTTIINNRYNITAVASSAAPVAYDQAQVQSLVTLANDLRTGLLAIGGLFF